MSEQFLRESYLEKKLSTSRIAQITGYAKSTVLKALKICGISRRSISDLKKEGLLLSGGTLPYGEKAFKGKIIGHKREQKIIRRIKKLRTEHKYNFSQIARYLTKKGIPTKKQQGHWSFETIRTILARENVK